MFKSRVNVCIFVRELKTNNMNDDLKNEIERRETESYFEGLWHATIIWVVVVVIISTVLIWTR